VFKRESCCNVDTKFALSLKKVTYFFNAAILLWELLQWKEFCYAFAKMQNLDKNKCFLIVTFI
jgi:hypothetical protein